MYLTDAIHTRSDNTDENIDLVREKDKTWAYDGTKIQISDKLIFESRRHAFPRSVLKSFRIIGHCMIRRPEAYILAISPVTVPPMREC